MLPPSTVADPAVDAGDPEVRAALGLDRPRTWAGFVLRLVIGLCVLAAIGGAAYLYIWWRSGPQTVYETVPARLGDVQVTVTATGTLKARITVDVGVEISGRVKAVHVDYNSKVKQGDLLAEIDPTELEARAKEAQAQVGVAEAAMKQAEATLEELKITLARSEQLAKRNANSYEEQLAAQVAFRRATAQLASAQAQQIVAAASYDAAQTNLAKTKIFAPIDGIVLERTVEPGQTVAAMFQTPILFTLAADLTRMELHVDVDEADIGRVREQQLATFTVDAYPGREFPAKVDKLYFAPQVEQNVVTYEAVLPVDNSDSLLRPGMTATANIVTDNRTQVLLVPNAALRFTPPDAERNTWADRRTRAALNRQQRVWVLKDGAPVAIVLETGATDGEFTEVLKGDLAAGTPLLVNVRD